MIYIVLFIISVVLTLVVRSLRLVDLPNHRSSHTTATPSSGGLAIVVAFYIGLFWLYFHAEIDSRLFFALLSGIILAVVGFLDDMFDLSPKIRIVAQIISVLLAIYFLDVLSNYSFVFTLFFILSILWLINLYNFLDGIDGYAGSEAIVVSFGAYLIYQDKLFIVLAMACLGFLLFNFPLKDRASIFMGDVGSTFLGFVFGVIALYHYQTPSDLIIWFVLLGLFIFDATLTLFLRFKNGEKLSNAHKKHLFQRVVQSGFSHQKTVLLAMGLNILFLMPLYFLKGSKFLLLYFVFYFVMLFFLNRYIDKKKSFDD